MATPQHTVLNESLSVLIAATAGGDRDAFATLYRQTSGSLLAVALRILRRRDAAEEVLQEAYLTIWSKATQRQAERPHPYAWMVAIVRNRAIDRYRSENVAQRHADEFAVHTETLLQVDISAPQAIEAVDKRVCNCLQALDEQRRSAILLAYYYGMTHDELVAELGAPLGTVKSWIRRGLQQLRECVQR